LQPKTFLLDIIKLMAHKIKQLNDFTLYDILVTLDFNVPHTPSAVLHKSYLFSRPGFSVDLIFFCTMFTLLTAFLTMFPLDCLAFALGETSSLCVEDRVRTIFFPLTKIKILHQVTTLSTIIFLGLASLHIPRSFHSKIQDVFLVSPTPNTSSAHYRYNI